jgi:hypothetical protein
VKRVAVNPWRGPVGFRLMDSATRLTLFLAGALLGAEMGALAVAWWLSPCC